MALVPDITIYIDSSDGKDKHLCLFGGTNAPLYELTEQDAHQQCEAPCQIVEGCTYDFELPKGYFFEQQERIVRAHKSRNYLGTISPNIYVGTLSLIIRRKDEEDWQKEVFLEVQSIKTGYRTDYQVMLKEIAEKCADLILQHSSPISQFFDTNHKVDNKTAYQRFAFLKSILDNEDFHNSMHKIFGDPVTKWMEETTETDIRAIKKIGSKTIRQIASGRNRIKISGSLARQTGLASLPRRILAGSKIESFDTPENRFVKFALESFLDLSSHIRRSAVDNQRLQAEAVVIEEQLEQYLDHSLFKETSRITSIPISSPVLQRKAGYREILRVWLISQLAAQLTWKGGEDIYRAGKRNVAALYEYWLFFKLLDIVKKVFKINPTSIENLIESTKDGLGLKLKQGNKEKSAPKPIQGVFDSGPRKLNVEFAFNRTFSKEAGIKEPGSWTRQLRPDYTLSIWPDGVTSIVAEAEELMVHIHFDAKYKVEDFQKLVADHQDENDEDDSSEEDQEQRESPEVGYKSIDLMKMHTYRDAIRRTAGAYVLYPGGKKDLKKGFHEILPGLGAFEISPSSSSTGELALETFLTEVLNHFLNRASQREQLAFRTYQVYQSEPGPAVREPLPETIKERRGQLPSETIVLVGYFKSKDHFDWILKNKLYNSRAIVNREDFQLKNGEASAHYLLIYNKDTPEKSEFFLLNKGTVMLMTNEQLIDQDYPDPSEPKYWVYEILESANADFPKAQLDFSKLGKTAFRPKVMSVAKLIQKLRKE